MSSKLYREKQFNSFQLRPEQEEEKILPVPPNILPPAANKAEHSCRRAFASTSIVNLIESNQQARLFKLDSTRKKERAKGEKRITKQDVSLISWIIPPFALDWNVQEEKMFM